MTINYCSKGSCFDFFSLDGDRHPRRVAAFLCSGFAESSKGRVKPYLVAWEEDGRKWHGLLLTNFYGDELDCPEMKFFMRATCNIISRIDDPYHMVEDKHIVALREQLGRQMDDVARNWPMPTISLEEADKMAPPGCTQTELRAKILKM